MRLAFASPWWLAGLVLVPAVVWWASRHRAGTQARIAAGVRAVAVAALVLVLAGPTLQTGSRNVDVAFVVDVSDSVAPLQDVADDWRWRALEPMRPGDRAAVIAVGRDAQLDHALRGDPLSDPIGVRVDGSETDLERGLRLAHGTLGGDQRGRVVLLTDGQPTRGDVTRAAQELAAAGIPVDVVPLTGRVQEDVLVDSVHAPTRVREGERYEVEAILRNTGPAPAEGELVVTADGEEVARHPVTLPPGRTTVVTTREAGDPGTHRYEARLISAASTRTQNDRGIAAVRVEGPATVLVVEGTAGSADALAAALTAGGLPVERVSLDQEPFPELDRLLDHDTTVLVDVAVEDLRPAAMSALTSAVRDAGRGLVAVGGERSYGLGGYDGTQLEDLLPVFARVHDPQRRLSVAQALVVDVSGSMAACHCRPEGFAGGPGPVEGGPNKTDISREAVSRAIAALDGQDTVGVLAFNANASWVLPLQRVPERAIVDDALATLHPEGETNIIGAVREAIAGLKDAEARLRHIVLFTDGFSDNPQLVDVAAEAAEAGITLSVVGTGEGPEEVLRGMATAGGGRFYPGRDLSSIPAVLATEVQIAARPLVEEGEFVPVVAGTDPVVAGLDATPPLLGYLATTEKPTARTLLRIGDERDPLLASWQVGLGTAVAWTSDAEPRWSQSWLPWEGYRDFWSAVVRSTLPGEEAGNLDVAAEAAPDLLSVTATTHDALGADATATAVLSGPDGSRSELPLTRTSLDTFEGSFPALDAGAYAVTVVVRDAGTEHGRRTVAALRAYPAEYAFREPDPAAIARIAAAGGGRVDPEPASAFDPAGLAPGRSGTPLDLPLLLVALAALPIDVGLRRLRLERADLIARRRSRPEGPSAAEARPAQAAAPTTPPEATSAVDVSEPAEAPAEVAPSAPQSSGRRLLDARRAARERDRQHR